MLPRWSRAVSHLIRVGTMKKRMECQKAFQLISYQDYAKFAAAAPSPTAPPDYPDKITVNLGKMFQSQPCSLALGLDSAFRIEEPQYEGVKLIIFKMLLFYSKQSKSIRGANVVYRRILSQVDKPPIYEVFNLEKSFKTTFSLLVLHMWLVLRRLKEDGKEGVDFGQYLYEIYNHDVELRVSKAGVNLLLSKWMKDLEKIFYGNVVAYDSAMLPEAKQHDLASAIWRNVFSDDGSPMPTDAASIFVVQAMARYAHRESFCLSLTGMVNLLMSYAVSPLCAFRHFTKMKFSFDEMSDKDAMLSGNFMFSALEESAKAALPTK